jgi:hypothetical protein
VHRLSNILEEYNQGSGQLVNKQKSELLFIGPPGPPAPGTSSLQAAPFPVQIYNSFTLHFSIPTVLCENYEHFRSEVLEVFTGLMKASSVQVRWFGEALQAKYGETFKVAASMGAGPSSVMGSEGYDRGWGQTSLGDMPESCVAAVLLYLDPPEICHVARLNHAFRGTASADCVWAAKLPATYCNLAALAAVAAVDAA